MIITTTAQIEGYRIRAYHGIVFGEVVSGVDFVKDFGAGLRNFFGGRSEGYEEELQRAREEALNEMSQRAARMGPTLSSVWISTMRSLVPGTT